MAITVNFYQNVSDNRCLEKTIIPVKENVSCDIYDPCDISDPILLIDIGTIEPAIVNYCIIGDFSRRYFITDIVPMSAKRLELHCHVDVLSTYQDYIRDCPLIAARSTNLPNYYLHDDMRLFNSYALNQYIDVKGGDVPNGDIGAPSTLVLMTIGKGNT